MAVVFMLVGVRVAASVGLGLACGGVLLVLVVLDVAGVVIVGISVGVGV